MSKRHAPATNAAFARLTSRDLEIVRTFDEMQLAKQRAGLPEKVAETWVEPSNSTYVVFAEWEHLTDLLTPSDKDVLIDDYIHVLILRSVIDPVFGSNLDSCESTLAGCLEELDLKFLECTEVSRPGEPGDLSDWLSMHASGGPDWLWNRRPRFRVF